MWDVLKTKVPQGVSGRDLDGYMISTPYMSFEMCIRICGDKGYRYSGVQYSTLCFCGNSYDKYGRVTNCDMRCAGNPNEI